MMVNLRSVDEEMDNGMPAEETKEALQSDEKEDKVRVDRRKLERMLQVDGGEDGQSAENFFAKVMLQTNTHISWPSKLKIGAKSKKDPHIKIAGLPQNIKRAKDMVVVVLESKPNRVTLKMDVSHTDHSHIIGRKGQCITRVMDETDCHIHFPDSNRGPGNTDKSNQVSIAGQPEGVEKARTRIRELLPLVLIFEVPYTSTCLPLEQATQAVQNISLRYDVTFTPRGRSPMGNLVVAVRGRQDVLSNIQEAMGCLSKHLTGNFQLPTLVHVQFDIAPQHHVFVVGRQGSNIKEIMSATGAKVEFPDPSAITRKGCVTITGSFDAVVQARALLLKSLPILLMFDLKEEEANIIENEPDILRRLMEKFSVTITVKPKPKQSSKSVIIKTKESNSKNMFLARLEILGTPMDPFTIQHPSLTTMHHRQSPEPAFFFPHPGMHWYPRLGQSPYSSPIASPTPCSRPSDSPVPKRTTPSPPRFPPGFEHLQDFGRSQSFKGDGNRVRSRSTEPDYSRPQEKLTREEDSPKDFDAFNYPRRNSEPTTFADPWHSTTPNMKQSIDSSSAISNASKPKFALIEGTRNASKGSHELLDSHGSVLGSSGASLSSSLSYNFSRCLDLTPQKKFVDYEKTVDRATQVMTRKIVYPQVRTPTDEWSGLHLSKSTPNDELRSQLGKAQSRSHHGLSSTDEFAESEDASRTNDFSMSFNVPSDRNRKGYASAFSAHRNGTFPKSALGQPRGPDHKNGSLQTSPLLQPNGLHDILKLYGVEDYAEMLEKQQIDFDVFLKMTKEDLKEAGVEPLGARKKMEHAIEDMKSIKERAIRDDYLQRAKRFQVTNPLDFNSQSGKW